MDDNNFYVVTAKGYDYLLMPDCDIAGIFKTYKEALEYHERIKGYKTLRTADGKMIYNHVNTTIETRPNDSNINTMGFSFKFDKNGDETDNCDFYNHQEIIFVGDNNTARRIMDYHRTHWSKN